MRPHPPLLFAAGGGADLPPRLIADSKSQLSALEGELAALKNEKPLDELTADECVPTPPPRAQPRPADDAPRRFLASQPELKKQINKEIDQHSYD